MSAVVDLSALRQRRAQSWRRIAEAAPHHPALRWHANGDPSVAHRRLREVEQTACGLPAVVMVLADRDVPRCPECYPT